MAANPEPAKVDSARKLFRHTIATVAYRGGKAMRGAPESFSQFVCQTAFFCPPDG